MRGIVAVEIQNKIDKLSVLIHYLNEIKRIIMALNSAGHRFRHALTLEQPLQIIGVINAYCAMMAEQTGFRALYLSGGGVANASFGLPDLGIINLQDVLEDARRIISITELPLLVDIDTGFGAAFNIQRTIKQLIQAGVAAVHIEDQVAEKRCGHRSGKQIVSTQEMVDRIKAAVDARTDDGFVIIARTDAFANEGLTPAIERAQAYIEAGADMIFAEALPDVACYQTFCAAISAPVLANMTEFGKTKLYTADELGAVGVKMVLYPRSVDRAMSKAALDVLQHIRHDKTQQQVLSLMQTRDELYKFLHYQDYEKQLDRLFQQKGNQG